MHYTVVSFTHKNTELEDREKLSFANENRLLEFYNFLKSLDGVQESIVLSTCNRVEVILNRKTGSNISDKIYSYLSNYSGIDIEKLKDSASEYQDGKAVHHIFSVVSSLDSLVLGETQIVGQVKDAFKFSYDHGFSGQKLARVMHNAFRCAATVRNKTSISKNPISVASVAVAQAKELFNDELGGYSAVIVGAGEMSSLAAKHLASSGVNLIIINRDMEKAYKLAKQIEGVTIRVEPFSELKNLINHFRLLFSATSAPDIIIDKSMVEEVSFKRYWFDLAVPRDIIECKRDDIDVYAVDDLQAIMNKNLAQREENAKIAYKIVGEFTEEFFKWLQTLSVDPLIKEIRELAKECSHNELQKAIKKGYIPAELEQSVEKILHQSFNSFLHTPTKTLKNVADLPQSDTVVQSIQLFFGLNAKQRKALDVYKCDYQIEKDLKDKS
jgi:glutamyl-tRNA reductase